MAKKNVQFDLNPLLSGPSLQARAKTGSPYRELNLADIDVDPNQPRKEFDTEPLAELAASIKQFGVLCPILVKLTEGGTYRIIAGERRYRASKLIGKETIPAIVDMEATDGEASSQGTLLSKQLIENLQRQDLNPLDRALAIGRLKDEMGTSIRETASRLGISKSLVQRSVEILELPDDLKAALKGGASESKVLMLREIPDAEVRKGLLASLDTITREDIFQALGAAVEPSQGSDLSHGGTGKGGVKRRKRELSAEDRRLAEEIQRSLGIKVTVVRKKGSKTGQGKLILDFYSEEDLRDIYQKLVVSWRAYHGGTG